jgi:asparagine synthase (glutamine-hydrolysing)
MGDVLSHRGPDAHGTWIGPGIGLVHRRLAIVDLAGGDQPIGNEDGSVQVVLNGEIYNYRLLRERLEARGHRFSTRSDTEVIVHLYEEEGAALVDRLRGMFAFALWDHSRRRLLLARDRLGIKPLYFARDRDRLVFGSEMKAILACSGLSRRVDPEALEDYLAFGMVPGSRSILEGIEKLPPAHVLEVGPDDLDRSPRRYWRLKIEPDRSPGPEEWAERIRAELEESVRMHLMADVPVGAFLSGGLDSGVVVALASQATDERLKTFTIGFREESFSELPYAREVANRYGTEHAEEIVTPDAVGLLDELAHYFDEPFADPSAIPTYLVSRMAAKSVKVVLSGDGGDEAFGGYARYAHDLNEATLRDWLPSWFRRAVLGPLGKRWPKSDWLPRPLRAKMFLTNIAMDADHAYANTLMLCRLPLRRSLIAPDVAAVLNGHDPGGQIVSAFTEAPPGDVLGGMIAADVSSVLPDDFLVKVDRASMAHGLEVRPPLLDHRLLELAATIPSDLKIREGKTKWILNRACGGLLPATVADRPKHGFEMPIDAWLRGPLRGLIEETVLDPRSRLSELINQQTARRVFRQHLSGVGRHGQTLWSLVILARWADRYLGSIPHPTSDLA